jgi:hypothetical protein
VAGGAVNAALGARTMRELRKTTTRWLSPIKLRAERFAELQAKKKYTDLLGAEFIAGLEKRNDLLEGRYYKGLAIQIPLFFILALSLLKVDVKTTFLGFSIESAKSIREILLVLSVPVALFMAMIHLQQASIKEMLKTPSSALRETRQTLRIFWK